METSNALSLQSPGDNVLNPVRIPDISLAAGTLLLALSLMAPSYAQPLNESAKVYSADPAADDLFGFSTAVHRDRILVGALKQDSADGTPDTGAAYMYRFSNGTWQPEMLHLPTELQANDGFGGKLALLDDMAAIGAIGDDNAAENAGIVYLYQRAADTWRVVNKVIAPDPQPGDAFGQSIALTSDTLVIGAPKANPNGDDSGAVYIFQRSQSSWVFEQKLSAPDGAAGDVFGISVAISGNSLLIGADLNDEKANNAGAAYVYVKQQNRWVTQAKLMADDGADTDIFGVRVAIDGDTALISARRDDHEMVGKDAGAAYVFRRSGNTWHQEAKLIGPSQQADDRFGRSVALSGDTALIGAMHKDYSGENAGAAYLFKREGQHWRHSRTLIASDAADDDLLGWSAALNGNVAVLGAARHAPGEERSGAAYIFRLEAEK